MSSYEEGMIFLVGVVAVVVANCSFTLSLVKVPPACGCEEVRVGGKHAHAYDTTVRMSGWVWIILFSET